jgi:DNA-binding MarR family transcriptional regulator
MEIVEFGMAAKPSRQTISTWARLVRVQQSVLAAVERDLKKAGYPPLAWYDALLELSRAERGELRPVELEKQMLLPQYSMSRLLERLAGAGFIERKSCPVDRRGQVMAITAAGRNLQKKMWNAYASAIERHVGAKLSSKEAVELSVLLGRLCPRV